MSNLFCPFVLFLRFIHSCQLVCYPSDPYFVIRISFKFTNVIFSKEKCIKVVIDHLSSTPIQLFKHLHSKSKKKTTPESLFVGNITNNGSHLIVTHSFLSHEKSGAEEMCPSMKMSQCTQCIHKEPQKNFL